MAGKDGRGRGSGLAATARQVLVHTTNPAHLVPSDPGPGNRYFIRIGRRTRFQSPAAVDDRCLTIETQQPQAQYYSPSKGPPPTSR